MPFVSLLIPAKSSAHALEATVHKAHAFFEKRYPGNYEIILIPNPSAGDSGDRSPEVAQSLSARHSSVRTVPHLSTPGKGAALRTGFQASRGDWIFFTDADLPYELEFFDRAAESLGSGYDFVTGNRRLDSSHFNVPVSLLPVAYGRHRLGLWFNWIVRQLFPIPVTDTQAGIKAMTRPFAEKAFSLQRCPGFFFDIEFFLISHGQGYRHVELPVTLFLNSEKSTVRVVKESIQAAIWLSRIASRYLRGDYGKRGQA